MSKGIAHGSADGPRYIYGKENVNWAGPKRAREPDYDENEQIFQYDEMLKDQRAARIEEKKNLYDDILHDIAGIGLNDWDEAVQLHPSHWGGQDAVWAKMASESPEQWENRMVRRTPTGSQAPRMNSTLTSAVFSYKDERGNPILSNNLDFISSLDEDEYEEKLDKFDNYLSYRREENDRQKERQKEDTAFIKDYNDALSREGSKLRTVNPDTHKVSRFDVNNFPRDAQNGSSRDNAIKREVAVKEIGSNLGKDLMDDAGLTHDDLHRVVERLQKTDPKRPRWEFETRNGFATAGSNSDIVVHAENGNAFYNPDQVNIKDMMHKVHIESAHDMKIYSDNNPGKVDMDDWSNYSSIVKQSDIFEQTKFLKQYSDFLNENGTIDPRLQ